MLSLYKKSVFLPKCMENLFLSSVIINMEFLTKNHLLGITQINKQRNITGKLITDFTKLEAVTNSKLVSLENEVIFF